MDNLYEALRFNASADALLDHWMNLRMPGTLCPAKKDFNPMIMGKYLPDVFMVEWIDEDTVIIRVAGSRTTDITHRDTTGNNLMDNTVPSNQEILKHFYEKMRNGLYAGVSEHRLIHAARPSNAISLQLPLLDENGDATFFVGVIKAAPIDTDSQNIQFNSKKEQADIHTSFANLNVRQAPIEIKLG